LRGLPRRWRQAGLGLLLGVLLLALPGLGPAPRSVRADTQAILQSQVPWAYVQGDGRQLFQVWASNDFSAEQRVEPVNGALQRALDARRNPPIAVIERNGLPVISIDARPLLTVTRRDTTEGVSTEEMAERWRAQLEQALARGRLEREPATIQRLALLSLALVAGALLVQRLLQLLSRRIFPLAWAEPPPASTKGYSELSSRFLPRALLRALQAVVWFVVVTRGLGMFPVTRIWMERLRVALTDSLASPFLPLGQRSYSVLDAIVLIALFVLLAKVLGWLQQLLRVRVLAYTGIGSGSQAAIGISLQYVLLFIGTLVLLQLWGLDLSSLALFASVFGVALGLGLQGITKNFISGLIIIFERPIEVGDFVEVGDLQGTVRRISLRCTEVMTLNRVSIIVPNAEFLESQVVNWSHGSPTSRLILPVGVAYGADCEAVRSALVEACDGYAGILQDPPPSVLFKGFGDSALEFHLLVWIQQPMRQYQIISDLNFRIEAVLHKHQITVPFPQRDVHLSGAKLQLEWPSELAEALSRLQNSGAGSGATQPMPPSAPPSASPTAPPAASPTAPPTA
jgi:potassium-dependent mechanosensitive channel